MRSRGVSPVLADAADVLSDQLRTHLIQLAKVLKPHLKELDTRFQARLQQLRFEPMERTAIAALTSGAAIRFVARGRSLPAFLEQVQYNGRRLAKLNLPPSDIVDALAEYDQLLAPLLRGLQPADSGMRPGGELPESGKTPPAGNPGSFAWAREQVHFSVILTLNKAYYEVREAEAETFYELSRAELESKSLDQLLVSSLEVLARFCGAREANLFLLNEEASEWVCRARVGHGGRRGGPGKAPATVACRAARTRSINRPRSISTGGRSVKALFDPAWAGKFAWVWSVPLISGDQVAGVMQFGFTKRYDWLPREQELLQAAAERCLVATEKARLVENLAAREEQIRRLAEHMLHIEEVERRRISRELHDEAGQSLLCIRLELEMLEASLPAGCDGTREKLAEVREITERTILETRRLIAALSPAVLEQLGLPAALRQLVRKSRQLYPCEYHLHISRLQKLPKRLETIVYRLAQECCNNIAKHSQASKVNISVTSADGILRLHVEDDGVGFSVKEALAKQNSFGLAGMRERVTLLGGNFEIQSEPGSRLRSSGARKNSGTKVMVELPIPESD